MFDYDFGLQDDFMGSAYLYLESLEQQRYVSLMISMLPFVSLPIWVFFSYLNQNRIMYPQALKAAIIDGITLM